MAGEIPLPREEQPRCTIRIEMDSIWMDWSPRLSERSGKPTKVDELVAGALLGIARAMTGRGVEAMYAALDQAVRPRKR